MHKNFKKFLTIIREGNQSVFEGFHTDVFPENYVFVRSYYENKKQSEREKISLPPDTRAKWVALSSIFIEQPSLLEEYDFFWFPDDDIDISEENVLKFFQFVEEKNLALAQPALSHDSYFSHVVTLKHSGATYRETNYVEIMAPCYSKELLRALLPLMSQSMTGWGLDDVGSYLAKKKELRIGIIDLAVMTHTRPVGNAVWYRDSKKLHLQELSKLHKVFGIKNFSRDTTTYHDTKGNEINAGNDLFQRILLTDLIKMNVKANVKRKYFLNHVPFEKRNKLLFRLLVRIRLLIGL